MNWTENISVLTVFLQGLLSFFSPCVLPLLPLYIGYLSGGAQTVGEDGTVAYQRGKVLTNTFFFVLGISGTFFLLGLGATAMGEFFSGHRVALTRLGGAIVLVFGLFQLGVFRSFTLSRERRLPFRLDQLAMNPLTALVMGFTFSFSWTPCVGPALTSVLLMVSSAASRGEGILLIGVYTLGFVLPFLAVGWFTSALLSFFKKHQRVVRFTAKAGGILLIIVGVMMLTGIYGAGGNLGGATSGNSQGEEKAKTEAPDFTLVDQYGNTHTLSEYRGKTVILNFWATWCPYCVQEMPDLKEIYRAYGSNEEDLVVLGVANPKTDEYAFANDQSLEFVENFLEKGGYEYPVVMDVSGEVFAAYGVTSLPTSIFIDDQGNIHRAVRGAVSRSSLYTLTEDALKASTPKLPEGESRQG